VHGFFFLTPNIPIFFTHFSGGRFWHPHISIWLLLNLSAFDKLRKKLIEFLPYFLVEYQ
jgi:hypothetical protein